MMLQLARTLNSALLLLYPIAWFAPFIHTSVFFGLYHDEQVSIAGVTWAVLMDAPAIGILIVLFAMIAPYLKIALTEVHFFNLLPQRGVTLLHILSRVAMADVFLVAIYIALAKGIMATDVQPLWGLYLFTICVLTGLALSLYADRAKWAH